MRHKRTGRKLGVVTKHRKAMLRNMVTDLFRHERIRTTDTRAKELRRVAEKMITLAKKGTLHKRRQAAAYIRDNEVLGKLFSDIAERFKDRPGGYTRIVKLGFRKGDNTPISLIELVEEGYKAKTGKKKSTAKKKPRATETAKSSKKESAEELGLADGAEAKEKKPKAKGTKKKSSPKGESASAKSKAAEDSEPEQAETPEEPEARETGKKSKDTEAGPEDKAKASGDKKAPDASESEEKTAESEDQTE